MPRILVLGAGFAGLWAAIGAARKREEIGAKADDTEILVIDAPADFESASSVLGVVETKLLTPCGLRSLSRDHPDYKAKYFGDLRSRDAAYHQGTVWGWLIGPFIDGWLKVHPGKQRECERFLAGFIQHLNEACVGSISEIFDGDPPFVPRGCISQAWSVAEYLRVLVKTSGG